MAKSEKIGRIDCSGDKPITTQSSAEECDINYLIERAKRGADLTPLMRTPMYGDFTDFPDLRRATQMVIDADASFMALPATVRERFSNNPVLLFEFLADDKNREEALKLGLLKVPDVPVPDEHLETLKSIDRGLKARSGEKTKRSDSDE